MRIYIALATGLVGGGGIALAFNGQLLLALLALPAVLYLGWLLAGLYFLDHWDHAKFKKSMWR